jgi:transcriptional regulator with XRE-family HTH domain
MKRNFVGEKVRRLRKERGMTQSELASRIGIIQSDLCRMEKGEYRVSLDTLFRILEVFGIAIGDFFEEAPGADVPAASEAEVVDRFRRLSDEAQREVLAYIRFKEQQDRKEVPDRSSSTAQVD